MRQDIKTLFNGQVLYACNTLHVFSSFQNYVTLIRIWFMRFSKNSKNKSRGTVVFTAMYECLQSWIKIIN